MSNKYLKKFIEQKGDKIKEKIVCEECGGTYSYFNKSHHKQTSKHVKIINDKKTQKEQEEKDKKIKELQEYIDNMPKI